jgi:hypothetical protein
LADRVISNDDDWAARVPFMSDEELDQQFHDLIVKAGGPAAICEKMGWAPDDPMVLRVWKRFNGANKIAATEYEQR